MTRMNFRARMNLLRRSLLRWRLRTRLGVAEWKIADLSEAEIGFRFEQQQEAFLHACRLLKATQMGEPRYGYRRKSIGAPVRQSDGSTGWLKITGFHKDKVIWTGRAELSADRITDVPKPSLLDHADWRAGDLSWRALLFSLTPSPTVSDTSYAIAPNLDDQWFLELRRVVRRISSTPLSRWNVHPGAIARVIARRFGRRAPYQVDEWRTAHGDLGWNNVTAPQLTLIDWEFWGAAPRGFDAATLLTNSTLDPDLFRRLETLFAEDLETPSGVIAQLYQFGQRLSAIESGNANPREYRPLETAAKRLLRH
jgi:hypothetical protein